MTNLESISHRCHPTLVAFVWESTKEIIDLPLDCLQVGEGTSLCISARAPNAAAASFLLNLNITPNLKNQILKIKPQTLQDGFRESRRYSRDTYPESYITKCAFVYEDKQRQEGTSLCISARAPNAAATSFRLN